MTVASWVLISFAVLELSNIFTMYFSPGAKYANAMGVFLYWQERSEASHQAMMIDYLVSWIAGVKLAMVALVVLILVAGDATLHKYACIVLLLTTLTFYWRLYPAIAAMSQQQALSPKAYHKVLATMIGLFCIAFTVGALLG